MDVGIIVEVITHIKLIINENFIQVNSNFSNKMVNKVTIYVIVVERDD